MKLYHREQYLKKIRPFYDDDLIKVITGIRRCGKSCLMATIAEELRDRGVDDKDIIYRWGGKTALGKGSGTYYPDWDTLVEGSNTERLCGYSDWRVPTRAELEGLVHYGRINPAIDTDYFPSTPASGFWSASPNMNSSYAWYVNFYYGEACHEIRHIYLHVRLVRSGR